MDTNDSNGKVHVMVKHGTASGQCVLITHARNCAEIISLLRTPVNTGTALSPDTTPVQIKQPGWNQ